MKRALSSLAATTLICAFAAVAMAQSPNTGAITGFDNGYLDRNPQIARELARNPALVDNPQYLATHPGLDGYLAHHPGIRTELQQHPERVMTSERNYEQYENALSPGNGRGGPNAGQVSGFDNSYLDRHPQIAQQLSHNPSLVDNPQFLATHPGLDSYLAQHPQLRAELQQHPYRFMNDEHYYERFENSVAAPAPGSRWPHGRQVSGFDNGYLDRNPQVAQQLSRNPSLVDNPQFLATHPGLDNYLAGHPGIRAELQQHPYRFMGNERRYEQYENNAYARRPNQHRDEY